jgi:hypothetical protein
MVKSLSKEILPNSLKNPYFLSAAVFAGLLGMAGACVSTDQSYLSSTPPRYSQENGSYVIQAPGYRIQQFENSTMIHIINTPATRFDFDGLVRGKTRLIQACGDVTVTPLKGQEEVVWVAKVSAEAINKKCLSNPDLLRD